MIKKIDILKFGLFQNYLWDKCIGKTEEFRRLNIIYGRNYSGKTTLARIFKCLEDKKLHDNYLDANFNITFFDGKNVSQSGLTELEIDYKIRVYNSDFVRENLSWLHNDDGTIRPFTILGAKNIELDKKIKEIEEKLGAEESTVGLIPDLINKTKEYEEKKKEYERKNNELDNKLRNKAQQIKNNAALYGYPTYQITTIKGDIPSATSSKLLTEKRIEERKKILKEETRLSIRLFPESKPNFEKHYSRVQDLLGSKIKPSKAITDLVNDSLLQEWVRQGIDRHKSKRTKCGFCGNPIPEDLWDKLDAHFNKQSEDLREELQREITVLESAKTAITSFMQLTKDSFYVNILARFEQLQKKWEKATQTYSASIDKLILKLKERENDIFKERKLGKIKDESDNILKILKQLNVLIEEHNLKSSTLSSDQQKAKNELRLSVVSQFLKDIEYKKEIKAIENLRASVGVVEQEKTKQEVEVNQFNEQKRELEAQAKDESKGAELVNRHLTHFFGHNELKLIAEGESPNIKFKIIRESMDAKNLSEGECSLISFCYFIARMEDEMKDDQSNSKLIIYIDDPISSLDSNHIFFMFSLIEGIITKQKKYGQLFISTHNLDFLKYLKKLTVPKFKPQADSKLKDDLNSFIIERKNKSTAQINLAPNYLKKYITEFNYLFNQIHKCSTSDKETISHEYQYNFGNNMRKFLEAYLFYKYPSQNLSLDQRLDKFFESDSVTISLINRVVNEYSHLGEHFDRGLEPIDVDEISKISKAVIDKIEKNDPAQLAALLQSIEE
jgi:wobble nucleotide-excising tRNase